MDQLLNTKEITLDLLKLLQGILDSQKESINQLISNEETLIGVMVRVVPVIKRILEAKILDFLTKLALTHEEPPNFKADLFNFIEISYKFAEFEPDFLALLGKFELSFLPVIEDSEELIDQTRCEYEKGYKEAKDLLEGECKKGRKKIDSKKK
jgi:hypothetical protein